MAKRVTLGTGPWQSVLFNNDPYYPKDLYDAINCYIPDVGKSGLYARPGMQLHGANDPTPGKGQAVFSFVDLDQSLYNFSISGGRIYRIDTSLDSKVDVTPAVTKYKLWFSNGTGTEPSLGDTITGAISANTGVVRRIVILSGAFVDSNAYGYYELSSHVGSFTVGEDLEVSAVKVGEAASIVTDASIIIDPDVTRVYWWSHMGQLVISDGVNPPWVVEDMSAPELDGQYIDIDGKGTRWSAYGRPQDYAGSWFFAVNEIGGVLTRLAIVWSSPGRVLEGYQQPDFDYAWELFQAGSGAITAIWGTNTGLYYFRDSTIGMVAGTPNYDFRGNHTADAISQEVGCLQSATIQQFGNNIFFCDQFGRPWKMPVGGYPESIWTQMRSLKDMSASNSPLATADVACSCLDSSSNLWIAAIWPTAISADARPTQAMVFDARTGNFVGRWIFGFGADIEAMGVLNDTQGQGALTILGTRPVPVDVNIGVYNWLRQHGGFQANGYPISHIDTGVYWSMHPDLNGGAPILTEDLEEITTEDGFPILVESSTASYQDDGYPPLIAATVHLGYNAQHIIACDMGNVITMNETPIQVTIETTAVSESVIGDPMPSGSGDGTYRIVFGATTQGRNLNVTVMPLDADTQFQLQRIEMIAVASRAAWQDH